MRRRAGRRAICVHIGTHKTGTTSIQAFLAAQPGALRAHGLYVPDGGHDPRPLRPSQPGLAAARRPEIRPGARHASTTCWRSLADGGGAARRDLLGGFRVSASSIPQRLAGFERALRAVWLGALVSGPVPSPAWLRRLAPCRADPARLDRLLPALRGRDPAAAQVRDARRLVLPFRLRGLPRRMATRRHRRAAGAALRQGRCRAACSSRSSSMPSVSPAPAWPVIDRAEAPQSGAGPRPTGRPAGSPACSSTARFACRMLGCVGGSGSTCDEADPVRSRCAGPVSPSASSFSSTAPCSAAGRRISRWSRSGSAWGRHCSARRSSRRRSARSWRCWRRAP